MKSVRGFFILENIIVLSLGSILMLAGLRLYHECFLTLQKKLILEDAIYMAETNLYYMSTESYLDVIQKEYTYDAITIKEVKICHNGKTVFSLAKTN